jgi:undecaprenyl-diphosphatase
MAAAPDDQRDPAPDRRGAAIAGLIVAAIVAVALTGIVVVVDGRPTGIDTAVHDFTRGWTDDVPGAVDVARFIGTATGPLLSTAYAVAIVAMLFLSSRRAAAGFLVVSSLTGVIAVEGMKVAIGRPRPPGAEQFLSDLDKSFPSGHSAAGPYLYLALGLILVGLAAADGKGWVRTIGIVLIVFSPVIGLSRIVLGVHWATDVVAGWAFGSCAILIAALLFWDPLRVVWRAPAPAV